jgi:hypothetical protein
MVANGQSVSKIFNLPATGARGCRFLFGWWLAAAGLMWRDENIRFLAR